MVAQMDRKGVLQFTEPATCYGCGVTGIVPRGMPSVKFAKLMLQSKEAQQVANSQRANGTFLCPARKGGLHPVRDLLVLTVGA